MARMVKRLSNLEIDEVSLVDRPANQHGLVAIAKSYQEDDMAVYDAEGNEVFEDELQAGSTVYDENGTEYEVVTGEDDDGAASGTVSYEEDEDQDGYYEEDEVGKARGFGPVRQGFAGGGDRLKLAAAGPAGAARRGRTAARGYANDARRRGGAAAGRAGQYGRNLGTAAGMQYRAIPAGGRAGLRYGGAAAGGAGVTHVSHRDRNRNVGKSLGETVLEELSKALTDSDRDQVIAKAADAMEEIAKRNETLEEQVAQLVQDREYEGWSDVAKAYELPMDPDDVGELMFRASQYMPQEDVEALDRMFSAFGEVTKAAMTEVGYNGYQESDVLGQVYALADEAVGKSDADLSREQAITALFAANPAAYDEYEAEQNRR